MIEEQVLVVAVEGDQLLLEAQVQSSCGGCAAKKGCGTALLSQVVGKKFTQFKVKNTINARAGDRIIIGLPEQALLTGSLVMYLLPLLGMIVLALIADAILAADAVARDMSVALSAFSGFGLGMLMARFLLSSRQSHSAYTPVIIKKLAASPESLPVRCTEV